MAPHRSRLEVVDGVERFHVSVAWGGRPWYWMVVHHVGGVVVDTGPVHARPAVARFLREHRVTDVLTTHGHEDHVGNHAAVPPGATVHAPESTLPILERGPPPFPFYRRFTWGMHGPAPGAKALGARVEAGGRAFRVVPTPGHSDDHVAFLDEAASAVYSGDAYLGKFRAARDEEDVHTELDSLRRLADLDPARLYPAHGPSVARPRAKLLETVGHFEALARRCHVLAAQGLAPRRIAREVVGREGSLTYFSGGEFSGVKLVRNLLRRPAP